MVRLLAGPMPLNEEKFRTSHFPSSFRLLSQEEFWILLLNQACKVINKLRISTGGIDGTYADVRTILREALIGRATQIALIHNHPSGHAKPSHIELDLMLSATARILILGDWINFFSYAVFDGENLFLENYIEGETQL